jgi:hypothetical protein
MHVYNDLQTATSTTKVWYKQISCILAKEKHCNSRMTTHSFLGNIHFSKTFWMQRNSCFQNLQIMNNIFNKGTWVEKIIVQQVKPPLNKIKTTTIAKVVEKQPQNYKKQ